MMIDDDGCDNDDDTDDDGCDNCMVHVALMMMESSKLEINPSIHPSYFSRTTIYRRLNHFHIKSLCSESMSGLL